MPDCFTQKLSVRNTKRGPPKATHYKANHKTNKNVICYFTTVRIVSSFVKVIKIFCSISSCHMMFVQILKCVYYSWCHHTSLRYGRHACIHTRGYNRILRHKDLQATGCMEIYVPWFCGKILIFNPTAMHQLFDSTLF
jgi:hypothetical protein